MRKGCRHPDSHRAWGRPSVPPFMISFCLFLHFTSASSSSSSFASSIYYTFHLLSVSVFNSQLSTFPLFFIFSSALAVVLNNLPNTMSTFLTISDFKMLLSSTKGGPKYHQHNSPDKELKIPCPPWALGSLTIIIIQGLGDRQRDRNTGECIGKS